MLRTPSTTASILFQKLFCFYILTDIGIGHKARCLPLPSDCKAAVDDVFLQLHIRDSVAQQTADPVISLIIPSLYGRACSAAWQPPVRTDRFRQRPPFSRYALPAGWVLTSPASIGMLNDGTLIRLCRNRLCIQIARTCRFAQRRADTAM